MSLKSRARAIQKLTGARYMAALNEIKRRGPLIGALRQLRPGMTVVEADAAICFEDEADLLRAWGEELFRLAFGSDWRPE